MKPKYICLGIETFPFIIGMTSHHSENNTYATENNLNKRSEFISQVNFVKYMVMNLNSPVNVELIIARWIMFLSFTVE